MRDGLGPGRLPRNSEFWAWKHEKNPFGRSLALVAEADSALVGLRVFMRWAWVRNGRVVPALRAVDTVTHPSWRGRGVFRDLTLRLVERVSGNGIGFVFNTPNRQSLRGYLQMGWQPVSRVSVRVKVLRPGALVRRMVGGAPSVAPVGDPGGRLDELLAEPQLTAFLNRVTGLDGDRWETPRTVRYLRWRYRMIPGLSYWGVWRLSTGAGAVVIGCTVTHRLLSELRICELMVTPDPAGISLGKELVRQVCRDSDAGLASAVAIGDTPEAEVLSSLGFGPAPIGRPVFVLRSLQHPSLGRSGGGAMRDWRLSAGDLELF
jgi:GNAT superfamily N-acetyltransferase